MEFRNRGSEYEPDTGFEAFGKPVPSYRRTAALEHARAMGCDDTQKITFHIDRACTEIQNDQPYKAMEELGMLVDLTGIYRLLAVLCVAEKPRVETHAA